jgi:hypothetical protein
MKLRIGSALYPVALAVSLTFLATAVHAAPVTSAAMGKKSMFAAEHDGMTVNGEIVPLEGTIAKAGKGILAVEAEIAYFSDATAGTNTVYQQLWVNNSQLASYIHPFSTVPGPETNCGTGDSQCTITATYWVDLDAAEAANPGTVKGQPLVVSLRGGVITGPQVIPYRASFSARMEKK